MSMFNGGGDIEMNPPDVVELSAQLAAMGDGSQPNPCSFYLINLAIDTTIGIPILVVLLRLLHHGASLTPLANPPESLRSGNYGEPPRYTWWAKQAIIYFIGLLLMKLCVYFIFQLLPWIAWVGDWCLRWTEGSEVLQITFVMFIFPVCMNALQYYIIDSFIKDGGQDGESRGTHQRVPTSEEGSEDFVVDRDEEEEDTMYGSGSGDEEDLKKAKREGSIRTKEVQQGEGQQSSGSSSRE